MRLGCSAQTDKNGFHGHKLVRSGEHADGGLAATQGSAEALAIGVIEPKDLVVQLAQQSSPADPDAEADGPEQTEHGTGRRAFACTRHAELVSLELAVLVEHEDADRVADGGARVLDSGRSRMGVGLGVENGDDESLLGHGAPPSVAPPGAWS